MNPTLEKGKKTEQIENTSKEHLDHLVETPVHEHQICRDNSSQDSRLNS